MESMRRWNGCKAIRDPMFAGGGIDLVEVHTPQVTGHKSQVTSQMRQRRMINSSLRKCPRNRIDFPYNWIGPRNARNDAKNRRFNVVAALLCRGVFSASIDPARQPS